MAVFTLAASAVFAAHYAFAELYFWPRFVASQRESAQLRRSSAMFEKGDVVPKIEITTIEGEKLTLGDDSGKTIVLNFFATWCNPCVAELPELEKARSHFAPHNNIKFVVVGVGHDDITLRQFREKNHYGLPFAADKNKGLYDQFSNGGIPLTYLILPDGTVAMVQEGYSWQPLHHLNARLDILSMMYDSPHGIFRGNTDPDSSPVQTQTEADKQALNVSRRSR
jgi:peroxiredoxin